MSTQSLADGVLAGDQRSIARAISVIETGSDKAHALLRILFGRTGSARVVGVTGAPGVGKSTLVDKLTVEWRRAGQRVGILAVDPTSPFSGGAILGDRIRMQTHSGDGGVFVRSMATRGHLGGLAQATSDAVVVLDAAGSDVVLIETVGVGQGEVDIARTADVSVVVTVPGAGDDVQALKAGIMEIGDVFVVNKADREGADRAVAEIQSALMLQEHADEARRPPVLKTEATTGSRVRELVVAIDAVGGSQSIRDVRVRSRAAVRLQQAMTTQLGVRLDRDPETRAVVEELIDGIARREVDPYTAAARILDGLSNRLPAGRPPGARRPKPQLRDTP